MDLICQRSSARRNTSTYAAAKSNAVNFHPMSQRHRAWRNWSVTETVGTA